MKSKGGRGVLKARRLKGRKSLAATMNNHIKKVNWKGTKAASYRANKESGNVS